ncbi:molybdopterin synthase sulfur carrier subunit [Corynebacterium yudongzhengii]|uniref:MoaD/ThiS family protein n=1 Tax=Corynebacterium yudongzhengii TaxID=2080740 RepID=A0A2U1T5K6_9CORY|nr:MoaD/ThiS family protein [Corynebacterium yudongzhengii]AWB81036.1 molybdopterin synthase sulfur carrier subunit [Corynebacterium yudongzhengii]PWC01281.1 MoaD/ThiS family protein [Corynebacterium yudongzhengii]
MEIHYFAAARAATGVGLEQIEAPGRQTTLGQVLDNRAACHTGTTDSGLSLKDILPRCTFLLDGRSAPPETFVGDAERIDVLPPFAGG